LLEPHLPFSIAPHVYAGVAERVREFLSGKDAATALTSSHRQHPRHLAIDVFSLCSQADRRTPPLSPSGRVRIDAAVVTECGHPSYAVRKLIRALKAAIRPRPRRAESRAANPSGTAVAVAAAALGRRA